MKKTIIYIGTTLILLALKLSTQAQQTTNTTGGNASGNGGTIAYSIGQVVYSTNTGATSSVAQGVQQPYEISIVSGIDNLTINLNLAIYPNPTEDFLTLNIGNVELSSLSYQVYNIRGELIRNKTITNKAETIQMGNLPSAIYFLKVTNTNGEIKIFEIIKK